jgi:hypothetical protein
MKYEKAQTFKPSSKTNINQLIYTFLEYKMGNKSSTQKLEENDYRLHFRPIIKDSCFYGDQFSSFLDGELIGIYIEITTDTNIEIHSRQGWFSFSKSNVKKTITDGKQVLFSDLDDLQSFQRQVIALPEDTLNREQALETIQQLIQINHDQTFMLTE